MVSDLYVFDLETLVWEKLPPHVGDDVPRARYFHSADHCEQTPQYDSRYNAI